MSRYNTALYLLFYYNYIDITSNYEQATTDYTKKVL